MNNHQGRRIFAAVLVLFLAGACWAESLPDAKPVPRYQALPLPHDQVSFQRDGVEIARYHYGADLRRPFVYPVIGPAGRSLTRMGHPHDPVTHSHHNSVWIAHEKVGGANFWADDTNARIVHEKLLTLTDGDDGAGLTAQNSWQADGVPVMTEWRSIQVIGLENGEFMLVFDIVLEPAGDSVEIGESGFGMMAVRMAKTIGVHDGGGVIRNSEGLRNEEAIFRKPTRWVDYAGPITNDAIEGITLMDHPGNPNHPAAFHVRGDGWMGACTSLAGPITIVKGQPLALRYGLYVHAGAPDAGNIEAQWKAFAELPAVTRE